MSGLDLKVDVTAFKRLNRALRIASRDLQDLRVPLEEIHDRFMQSRRFIFKLKSPGLYEDLSPAYKKRKAKFGPVYPILRDTGRLERSVTTNNGDHIKIIRPKHLTIGSSVPYADFHQEGTRKMPKRPFLFWGPESKQFARHSAVTRQNFHMAFTLFNFIERRLGAIPGVARDRAMKRARRIIETT